MNIYTVRDNLKNTIAGKEELLDHYQENLKIGLLSKTMDTATQTAVTTSIEFLKLNILELTHILEDVEQCCEKATADSWATNPDRSGGQFTQDELYNPERTSWIEP